MLTKKEVINALNHLDSLSNYWENANTHDLHIIKQIIAIEKYLNKIKTEYPDIYEEASKEYEQQQKKSEPVAVVEKENTEDVTNTTSIENVTTEQSTDSSKPSKKRRRRKKSGN